MEKNNKNIGIFFTYGVSMKDWESVGNLHRELLPYIEMSKKYTNIYFFTYGNLADKKVVKDLPANMHVLPNITKLPPLLYSLIIPFVYFKELRNCSIIKTSQMNGSWSAVITKILFGNKLMVRCGYEWYDFALRGNKAWWKRHFIFLIEKISYKMADAIILTSESARAFIIKYFHVNDRKINLIPNYVDTEVFKPKQTIKERGKILFVGRLSEQKNLHNLISAVSEMPNVKLGLVGSGELQASLYSYAKEKLGNRVTFIANVPNQELPIELSKAEIFILPSLYEGNPKVLLEAMSCGLPCIGTNVEGIQNIINHKINGYLCSTDVKSIHNAITELLNDTYLQTKLSKGARETIIANYSFFSCFNKEMKLHEKLYETV